MEGRPGCEWSVFDLSGDMVEEVVQYPHAFVRGSGRELMVISDRRAWVLLHVFGLWSSRCRLAFALLHSFVHRSPGAVLA